MRDSHEITFEVTIEHWADEDEPTPTENDIHRALTEGLSDGFDIGAITVVRS